MGEFDRARAQALLDLYGYVDRDGDGWREQPDGTPLVLEYATQPDELSRQLDRAVEEEHGRDRHAHRTSGSRKWPENLKAVARRQADDVGRRLERPARPTATTSWCSAYGPSKGQANHARFDLPAFNACTSSSA